jgi:hypothetical protein
MVADPWVGAPRGVEPVQVWAQDITIAGAPWMRLRFGAETVLTGRTRHAAGSYLVITSVADGARQYFDSTTLPEWDRISAFFNGESVRVELYAVPGRGENRVAVEGAIVGAEGGGVDTICGAADNRVPYNDPRCGRLSTGCTGWLITRNGAANEFLTAGHCISNGQGGALMMFNVPPATAAGGFVAPPVEFQFPVQSGSIQSAGDGPVGDDYARFNTNNNSNTGLAARIAQGRGAYVLASAAPAGGTAATTVRGNGIVNDQAGIPLVPEQWQRINKTHTGSYAGRVGDRINYFTDTDNSNSGSPVTQFLGTPISFEQAIGIHTDGFCPGDPNSGTAIDNAGLQAILAGPNATLLPYDATVSKALNTTTLSDNGGSDGGSIFFDVVTGDHSIQVTHLFLNINRNGTTNNGTTSEDDDFFNFDVYIRPGTAAGFEGSNLGWTHVADGAGMPKFEDEYSLGALKNTFTLAGSQSYGVAIVFDNGAGHAYTNADGTNETYSNTDLSITGISASNSAFGTTINGRVFNGGIGYRLNQSSGQCLETLFAQNNNGSNGGMVFFDVDVGALPLTLTGLTTNVEGAGGLNCNLTLYRKSGTYVGFETNPASWTQVATASGPSGAIDTPSSFGLNNFVTLNANASYGFALALTTSGTSEGHAYTNGNGLNQSYSDGRLSISLGAAANTAFGTPFSPRVWNGSLCYGVNLAVCSNTLAAHRPPDPTITGFNSTPGGQEEADSFSNAQNWSLSGATFWGAFSNSATPPANQDFVVRIFADSGGLPGALVASRSVANVALLNTGLFMDALSGPIYQSNMSFTPVFLPPGQYWISALGNQPGFTWAWARTGTTANAHAVRIGAGAWGLGAGDFAFALCGDIIPTCYANCDHSTTIPVLNVADFACFLNAFAAGESYANCDGSTTPPVLNVADFACFLNAFAAGCS